MTLDNQAEAVGTGAVEPKHVISKSKADMGVGLASAAIGAVVLSQAVQSRPGLSERLDPRTVPVSLSVILVVCGLGLIVTALRYKGSAGELDWPTVRGWKRVLISTVAFGLYAQALGSLGLGVSTFVFVGLVEWALDRGSIVRACIWGLGSGVVGSVAFIALLGVQLPTGPVDNFLQTLVGR